MLSIRNAKCSNAAPNLDSNIFKFPKDIAPGDVLPHTRSSLQLFTPGTFMFHLTDVIIPNIIGTLIFLFFLSTSVFLSFSVLRLLYLDKLKPYKLKKLRALGKHHHYYRHQGDFEEKNVKKKRKSNTRLQKLKTDEEEEDDEDSEVGSLTNHPPGQQLSYTAPPQSTARGKNYPDVMDLMDRNDNLPELSHFPSEFPRLYIGGKGNKGTSSKIPVMINKKHTTWGWSSEWYKKQLIDEKKTAKAVQRLQSSRNFLSTRASEKLLIKPSKDQFVKESVQTLYKGPSTVPPSSAESQGRKIIEVVPSGQSPSPPPITPVRVESKVDTSTLDTQSLFQHRQDIASRYTFRLEEPTSTLYTQIPKPPPKKSYHQLMILRAGPRKKASEIEEIRKKRRSSGTSSNP